MSKEEAAHFFGNDMERGFVVGKVEQVIKNKKKTTFNIRFHSLQLTTNKQPLSYMLAYGQNIPDVCFQNEALDEKKKLPELKQNTVSTSIKEEGTSSCFFARGQKKLSRCQSNLCSSAPQNTFFLPRTHLKISSPDMSAEGKVNEQVKMATNSELTNSTAAFTNTASLATEKMELTGNFMGILGDISAEETAIMIAQIHEDELSHTPNVGDPIRPDIVTSHEEFLAKHVAIVRTCFGDNFGLLCNLVNGNTEKNVANVYFQRSDLHRMLSTKMYRDNSMEMHSKVLAVRCATGTTPKRFILYLCFGIQQYQHLLSVEVFWMSCHILIPLTG